MIIFGFIIIALAIILIVAGFIISENDNESSVYFGFFAGVVMMIGSAMIISAFETPKPTAIDVYRGNTTLQITYQDSIPVDSVVVFKNK